MMSETILKQSEFLDGVLFCWTRYVSVRQDNDNFSKNPVFMRFSEVTRQQDNEIAFQTIYLYILLLYIPYFFLYFTPLCHILFYFLEDIEKRCLHCLIMPSNTDKYWIFYKTTHP